MTKHLSSAAVLLREQVRGSTGSWWGVPAVHNHCDSLPWEHQGLSTTFYPAQTDINNSYFLSQRENIPFPTCLSCASKQKRKQAWPWLSLSWSHASRHLPSLTSQSLYCSLISKHEGFCACRASLLTVASLRSHLNPPVDSVAACSSAAGQQRLAGTQRRHAAVRLGRAPRTRQESSPRHAVTGCKKYSGELQRAALSLTSVGCFCAGRVGMGAELRANSSAAERERGKNPLVCCLPSVVGVRHRGQTPGGDRQLPLPLQKGFCSDGDGNEPQTQELESGARFALC